MSDEPDAGPCGDLDATEQQRDGPVVDDDVEILSVGVEGFVEQPECGFEIASFPGRQSVPYRDGTDHLAGRAAQAVHLGACPRDHGTEEVPHRLSIELPGVAFGTERHARSSRSIGAHS